VLTRQDERSDLKVSLKNRAIPSFIAGDANEPYRIMEATEPGADAEPV
jgi:hypothetical protein